LIAARNNLALAYAADGQADLANSTFLTAGSTAAGLYNIGIIHLAEGRYESAVKAFDAASCQRPAWAAARRRATAARALAPAARGGC
jgi:hypothetical protein